MTMQKKEMTEKEKALKGLLYNPNKNEELIAEILSCKQLCFEYNQIPISSYEERGVLIKKIIGKVKGVPIIFSPFYCDYGRNIEIGENFFANHNLVLLDGGKITFGDNVFIGPNCCFSTAGHPIDKDQRNEGLEFAYPITIGNSVWIGANVTILPDVTIGDNSIVGAGSVVTKDIPSDVIAVGNPCKVLRTITDDDKNKYKKLNIIE